MTSRASLVEAILKHKTTYPDEHAFIARFVELLANPRCFFRDHLPGHITASAWITDSSQTKVLLTHHAKLNRWLQPGGHADGDEDVLRVAAREAKEETGLTSIRFAHKNILDLDIHPIPARGGFPDHDHYDVRFLFVADASEKFTVTEESHDLAWVRLNDLATVTANNQSMLRMAAKTLK